MNQTQPHEIAEMTHFHPQNRSRQGKHILLITYQSILPPAYISDGLKVRHLNTGKGLNPDSRSLFGHPRVTGSGDSSRQTFPASQHPHKGKSMTKLNPEVYKTLAYFLRGLKPVEAYLQECQQLQDAFRALRDEKTKVKDEGLAADEEALRMQKNELEDQFDTHCTALDESAARIRALLFEEFEDDLIRAAEIVSLVLGRLHALNLVVDLGDTSHVDEVSKTKIPSLFENCDLVIKPYRFHHDGSLMNEAWRNDADAITLHRQLQPFADTCHRLRHLEVDMEFERDHVWSMPTDRRGV